MDPLAVTAIPSTRRIGMPTCTASILEGLAAPWFSTPCPGPDC